jgi:hypothetical protein
MTVRKPAKLPAEVLRTLSPGTPCHACGHSLGDGTADSQGHARGGGRCKAMIAVGVVGEQTLERCTCPVFTRLGPAVGP